MFLPIPQYIARKKNRMWFVCTQRLQIAKMADSNRIRTDIRSVYLVTYSQAAETWTRETFENSILSQFKSAEARVRQWVCSQENHQEGGIHVYIAIKLARQKRWIRVRNELALKYFLC